MHNAQLTPPELTPSEPLQDWKNPPKVSDLKQDLLDAQPSHDRQVSKVKTWLDHLNIEGEARVKTPEGRSEIVPKLIRKQAEWRYASLSEPFLSTPDLFDVSPITWEDRDAAKQNQLLLNNQFNTKINKVSLIDEYVRTAVDEGTAIIRVGWEYEEETAMEAQPVIELVVAPETAETHAQLHQLMEADPQGYFAQVPPEWQQAHEQTMTDRVFYRPEVVGEEQVEVTKTIKNQPTVEICDFKNITVDPSCRGEYKKARFVVYSFTSSMSELKKDGRYKNLEYVNVENSSILGEPDYALDDESGGDFNFNDKPRKRMVVHEYWGYWDIDGTGIVKPIVATWIGDTLIRLEENPFPDKQLPFVFVRYLPVRKEVHGEPDGALLIDNQKVAGAVTRGMIDVMARSANGQMGMRRDALDPVNWRKFQRGEDYQFNPGVDARQAIYMHTYPEIPASAQFMLALQNNEAEALTGTKAFADGISGEALGNTAAAVRGALDAASKRELGILRRLAKGMEEVGRKIIAMNAVFLDEEEVIRVTNEEFVPVRRDDLAGNFDLRLSISTAEEDNAKAQELAFMLQTMGPQEDPEMRKMILADIARLRKMPDLAKKIEAYQPQPDPVQQALAQLEIQLKEGQIRKLFSEVTENEAEAYLDQAKALVEQARAANLQSDTDQRTLDFVEQESGVKQERDLQKQGAQARANAQLEVIKAQLNKSLGKAK